MSRVDKAVEIFASGRNCSQAVFGAYCEKYGVDGVKSYDKTAEFAEKFCKRNKSIQCSDLMGVEIQTKEGMEKARSEGLFDSVCVQMVKDAAEVLEEMRI